MSTETYLNSTPKGCGTCLFADRRSHFEWMCRKTCSNCKSTREAAEKRPTMRLDCDINFSGWAPIPPNPPRRSLRRWLYETFWE